MRTSPATINLFIKIVFNTKNYISLQTCVSKAFSSLCVKIPVVELYARIITARNTCFGGGLGFVHSLRSPKVHTMPLPDNITLRFEYPPQPKKSPWGKQLYEKIIAHEERVLRRALIAALDNVVCDHPEHAGIDTELYINKNRKLKNPDYMLRRF